MKILHVSLFFKPMWEAGGVARVVYEISRHLVNQGHEVTVYTTNMAKESTNIKTNCLTYVDGIKVYYFENLRKYLKLDSIKAIPYYLPLIIRKEIMSFDVIHIHEHRTLLSIITYLYARKYSKPYVIQSHGSVLPFYAKQRTKQIFDKIIGFDILKNASGVIALNQSEANQYMSMGLKKDKIVIVPNGINLKEFQKLPDKGLFRKKYGIKNNEKIILYLGRLHGTKGIELLIRSFKEIKRKLENVKLVIVGGGDTKPLKNQVNVLGIDNSVIFTGFVDADVKKQSFVDADVFVIPSFTGFPVTILESCACGTPIVTTNKGDFLNWIDNNVGFVTEYDNQKLADTILKILNDKKLIMDFKKNCKKVVYEEFNWTKITEQLLEEIYN